MRLPASNGGMSKGLLPLLFDDNASLVPGGTDLFLLELAGAPKIQDLNAAARLHWRHVVRVTRLTL